MPWNIKHASCGHSSDKDWQIVEQATAATADAAEKIAVEFASRAIACDDERFEGDGEPFDTIISITYTPAEKDN